MARCLGSLGAQETTADEANTTHWDHGPHNQVFQERLLLLAVVAVAVVVAVWGRDPPILYITTPDQPPLRPLVVID